MRDSRLKPFRLCPNGRLFVLGVALFWLGVSTAWASGAQSGRRPPAPRNPVPAATPQPSPGADSSSGTYSESEARGKSSAGGRNDEALYSFYVLQDEDANPFLNLPLGTSNLIAASFVERLRQSPVVAVSAGGRGDRAGARRHAKSERAAFTVLLEVDEERTGPTSRRAGDPVDLGSLVVKYYVYAPQTATLKAQGQVYMRPYQGSARIGGIRLPVPTTSRTSARVPVEYVLRQAGHDAAERVMGAFDIRIPDRP